MTLKQTIKLAIAGLALLSLSACMDVPTGPEAVQESSSQALATNQAAEQPQAIQSYGIAQGKRLQGTPQAIAAKMTENVGAPPKADATYYFAFNSSEVNPTVYRQIVKQVAFLKKHPNKTILLAGNTDQRGSREYNIALGERRALAIANIFEIDGIAKNRVQWISYGEERPAALGHTENAYKLNRRVNLSYGNS